MRFRILIVDDVPQQVDALARILEQEGYEVVIAKDDLEAWYLLEVFRPDLVILDIGLGHDKRGGLDLLKRIKAKDPTIPIMMLTGQNKVDLVDLEVRSFKLKAVDFVRKTSEPEVIVARVNARLPQGPIEIDGRIKVDPGAQRVWVTRDGEWQEAELEPREFELLLKLVLSPVQVILREVLWELFPDAEDADGTLNRYISELRRKLEPDPRHPQYILTKWGRGYWFKNYR
jgi:DNA-binding response OmpR family regulator